MVHLLRHQLHVQHPDALSWRDRRRLPHAGGAAAQDRPLAAALGHRQSASRSRVSNVYRAETQSISRLKPAVCYDYIFPKRFNLERVSYYFDHEMGKVVDEEHYDDLLDGVARWQQSWTEASHPILHYRKAFSTIVIEDGRRRKWRRHSYSDGPAALYEYCADARTPRDIASAIGSELWVQQALDDFVCKDLMLFMDGRYLSLALPQNPSFELSSDPQRAVAAPGIPEGFVLTGDLVATPQRDRTGSSTGQ